MSTMGYGHSSATMLRLMAGIPGYTTTVVRYSPEVIAAFARMPGPRNKPLVYLRGTDNKNYAVGSGVTICESGES